MKKLLVRNGKTVYDDALNMLGQGGTMLELNAPVRESDRSKVVEVEYTEGGDDEPDDDFDHDTMPEDKDTP